jgi:hypothetical protein
LFGAFVGAKNPNDDPNMKFFLTSEVEANYWRNIPSQDSKGSYSADLIECDTNIVIVQIIRKGLASTT